MASRANRNRDDPGAFPSRAYLRRLCVGKNVSFETRSTSFSNNNGKDGGGGGGGEKMLLLMSCVLVLVLVLVLVFLMGNLISCCISFKLLYCLITERSLK